MKNYSENFLSSFNSNLIETNIKLTEKKYHFLSDDINGYLLHQIIREGIELLKFDIKPLENHTLKGPFFSNCLVFIYLEKGNFSILNKNKENVNLKKEEIFFSYEYHKNLPYSVEFPANIESKGVIIIINKEDIDSFIDDQEIIQCIKLLKNETIFKQKHIKNFPARLTYLFQFILHYRNYLGRKLFALGKINEIVCDVITLFLKITLNETEDSSPFEKIKNFIDENYQDSRLFSKIQSKFYFNILDLKNEFKEKTGFGIYEYLKDIKLEEAYFLLVSQKIKVTKVSESLGYKNFGYFSKIFKDYFGVSPKNIQQIFKFKKNLNKNL